MYSTPGRKTAHTQTQTSLYVFILLQVEMFSPGPKHILHSRSENPLTRPIARTIYNSTRAVVLSEIDVAVCMLLGYITCLLLKPKNWNTEHH